MRRLVGENNHEKVSRAGRLLIDGAWICSQLDLVLHWVLATGIWSQNRPKIAIQIPTEYLAVAEQAGRAFLKLLAALEDIWQIVEHDKPITGEMDIRFDCKWNSASLCIQIDPEKSTYLDSRSQLPENTLIVRRACFPFDIPHFSNRGSNAPFPISQLRPSAECKEESLRVILHRVFAKKAFRAGQVEGIRASFKGNDSLLLLPTGHGKSLVFQLASFLIPGITLAIEAWRALINDQIRSLQDHGISRAIAIHRESPLPDFHSLLNANLVYVAPERLYFSSFLEMMSEVAKRRGIDFLVIDEAHAVSEVGHSFRPSYLDLTDRVRFFCDRWGCQYPVTLALTATAADLVIRDLCGILGIEREPIALNPHTGGYTFVRSNLTDYPVLLPSGCSEDVIKGALKDILLREETVGQGIIFCTSKGLWRSGSLTPWYGVQGTIDELRTILEPGERISWYYGGDLSDEDLRLRAEMVARFMEGRNRIMVATNAFGTGVDKSDIKWVIHLGLPSGLEAYYQELGRAGRNGEEAFGFPIFDRDGDEIFEAIKRTEITPDSFEPLADLLHDSRVSKGSFARQLQLLVGKNRITLDQLNDPGRDVPRQYLPSFPGWRYESDIVDHYVINRLEQKGGGGVVDIPFASVFEPLIWKSVHRLKELGLIGPDYTRTFYLRGLNSFSVKVRPFEEFAQAESLCPRVQKIVGRMRGLQKGKEVAQKLMFMLAAEPDPKLRLMKASGTILRNTYEVVRECRVSSMIGLFNYVHEQDQKQRHFILEDYFSHDAFSEAIFKSLQLQPSIDLWKDVLDKARAQPYWRIGVFQRAAEAFPGAGLPAFLLLIGALEKKKEFETEFYLHRIVRPEAVPDDMLGWVLDQAVGNKCERMNVLLDAIEKSLPIWQDEEHDRVGNWVLTRLPDAYGIHALAHHYLARWIRCAMEGDVKIA